MCVLVNSATSGKLIIWLVLKEPRLPYLLPVAGRYTLAVVEQLPLLTRGNSRLVKGGVLRCRVHFEQS